VTRPLPLEADCGTAQRCHAEANAHREIHASSCYVSEGGPTRSNHREPDSAERYGANDAALEGIRLGMMPPAAGTDEHASVRRQHPAFDQCPQHLLASRRSNVEQPDRLRKGKRKTWHLMEFGPYT
jgi:hypothetical protein